MTPPNAPRGARERQLHPLASMLEENGPAVLPPKPHPSIGFGSKSPSVSFSPEAYAVELDGKPPIPPPPFPLPFGSDFLDIWSDSIIEEGGGYQGNGRWYDANNRHGVYQMPHSGSRAGLQQYPNPYPGGYGLERLNSPRKSNTGGNDNVGGGGWQRIELTRQSAVKSVKSSSGWWLKDEGDRAATTSSVALSSLFAIFYTFLCLFV